MRLQRRTNGLLPDPATSARRRRAAVGWAERRCSRLVNIGACGRRGRGGGAGDSGPDVGAGRRRPAEGADAGRRRRAARGRAGRSGAVRARPPSAGTTREPGSAGDRRAGRTVGPPPALAAHLLLEVVEARQQRPEFRSDRLGGQLHQRRRRAALAGRARGASRPASRRGAPCRAPARPRPAGGPGRRADRAAGGQLHQLGRHQRQEAVAQVTNDVFGERRGSRPLLHGEGHRQ